VSESCFGFLCFIPLDNTATKFFGFAEFLTGLALLVLAWTIADVRYRFRLRTTPIPLQSITFGVVVGVGVLVLLTDLWRAEGWLVPRGNLLTPAIWQAMLGAAFFGTFLVWAWFAFIRPPTYSKRTAERFAQTLYTAILRGSPTELSVIADELAASATSLIHYATEKEWLPPREDDEAREKRPAPPKVSAYADEILLLVADRRFCRVVVDSAPILVYALFREISKAEKYNVYIGTFARNIVNEALLNKNSFMFHEAEGYESGLIGYHKPLTTAMFSNYRMVEATEKMLDPDFSDRQDWNATQWKAYCRVVLLTFSDYVNTDLWSHSFVLFRAKGYIQDAIMDLYKLDGIANSSWNDDAFSRLRVVVDFIQEAIKLLDAKSPPTYVQLRIRKNNQRRTFYDYIAEMIFEVIFHASKVTSPRDLCWWVQHNCLWGELFSFRKLEGPGGKIVAFKVRRLLYDEVSRMDKWGNFKGASILGYCLNVMGLSIRESDRDRGTKALHKAILQWTKNNYARLYYENPQVGDACLVDGFTYDASNHRLVRTYPANGLRREPSYVYLDIDSIPNSSTLNIEAKRKRVWLFRPRPRT
jgi:hypothetical protein